MHVPKRLYIAATSQHVGKTTTTLGLLTALRKEGLNPAYCKPVGQQSVDFEGTPVDKDAALFAQYLDFNLVPHLHSPVILGSGVVASYLDNPDPYDFDAKVFRAARDLEARHDVVVYEGTGHPGVGSAVRMSNADVACKLGAGVVLVVEAGIGRTLDQLALNKALFEQRGVPIVGVIVNKVNRKKLAKVSFYLKRELKRMGLPLLGIIPYEPELALPLMQSVRKAIDGEVWLHPGELNRPIRGVLSSASIEADDLRNPNHWMLVVSDRRVSRTLRHIRDLTRGLAHSPLAGVVITGEEPCMTPEDLHYLRDNRIPTLITPMDTYEVVLTYGNLEVKLNSRSPWKMERAIDLFHKNSTLEPLLEYMHV